MGNGDLGGRPLQVVWRHPDTLKGGEKETSVTLRLPLPLKLPKALAMPKGDA